MSAAPFGFAPSLTPFSFVGCHNGAVQVRRNTPSESKRLYPSPREFSPCPRRLRGPTSPLCLPSYVQSSQVRVLSAAGHIVSLYVRSRHLQGTTSSFTCIDFHTPNSPENRRSRLTPLLLPQLDQHRCTYARQSHVESSSFENEFALCLYFRRHTPPPPLSPFPITLQFP